MRRYLLHETFDIYNFEADIWPHPVHNHTYYEIIFITKGTGLHNLNGNTVRYKAGDIFFLGPEDFHSFEIRTQTAFSYIRFNELLYNRKANQDNDFTKILGSIFSPQKQGTSITNERDKDALHLLLPVLQKEHDNRHALHYTFVRDTIMKSILAVIARNYVQAELPRNPGAASSVADLVLYIRRHIDKPDALKLEQIAPKFGYSPLYLSTFFKKHTGESLKDFIVRQRLKQVETRLLYSTESLASISDEFGFTDESHLCRTFKKYKGVSPIAFRRQ